MATIPDQLRSALASAAIDVESVEHLMSLSSGEVFGIRSSGKDAVELWARLRRTTGPAGYYPVVFGPREEADDILQVAKGEQDDVSRTMTAAGGIQAQEWLDGKFQFNGPQDEDEEDEEEGEGSAKDALEGEWPEDAEPSHSFVTPTDILSGKFLDEVVIGLIPAKDGADVPGILQYGGWNDCPMPEEHVAVLRYWNREYGAEIACMTHDIIECQVLRPPTTREAALALARQQYGYCYDIVEQGTGTLSALAAALMNSRHWYFWWD